MSTSKFRQKNMKTSTERRYRPLRRKSRQCWMSPHHALEACFLPRTNFLNDQPLFKRSSCTTVQGSEIRYADSTKQVPSRARQNRQARAGTNFTKPRTSLFSELCTPIGVVFREEKRERRIKWAYDKLLNSSNESAEFAKNSGTDRDKREC